jgi:GH24 family phage-related lysozyme (muramidase)
MRPSVRAAFRPFTVHYEGCCPFLYLDVKGLVTCAIGNLVDPVELALPYPWMTPGGTPAAEDAIRAEWAYVKSRTDLAPKGGGIFASITTLRLSDAGIDQVMSGKLNEVDAQLAQRFAGYPSWPADAQLAVLSIAWAAGAAWKAPKFQAFADAGDFAGCATESGIHSARDPADAALLQNAAHVIAEGLDPDVLQWPNVLA